MIQNYDKFSRWNAKFEKFTHFEKLILFKNDWHKTCDLLVQLYVFLMTCWKKLHSKILSYEKVKNDEKIFIVLL
jgi:hypothetical protein